MSQPGERVSYSNCSLCEASCGIEVRHDGKRIHAIRGDADDPFSRGFVCPKVMGLKEIHEDPDRLKRPLLRKNGSLVEVSWGEALEFVGGRIAELQRAHGKDAVAVYTGNPLGHSYAGVLYALLFGQVLGTRQRYSAQSVDALPRLLTVYQMYGNQALLPVPDLERTDYLLVFGANPVVSNGSIMTAPDIKRRLRALRTRGGRVVVLDPRLTETAREADEHVFVRPSSDAYILFSMLHTLFDEGLVDLGRLAPMVDGLATVERLVRAFSPERVAGVTGVAAADLRRLTREFAQAKRAVVYGRMGISTQRFGALASWAVELMNVLTGNLDRPGGSMFNTPLVDLPGVAAAVGQAGSFARFRSRVGGLPEFAGELPVAAFADELEAAGPERIRGLVTIAGNPVLSLPNGKRLERAFASLDLMVSVDIYLNETTKHAHVVLPTTFGLERDDYPILASGMGVRNRARYAAAVVDAEPDTLHDWQVFIDLARALAAARGDRSLARALGLMRRVVRPRQLLALFVRLGPYGVRRGRDGLSLDKLGEHGLDLGALEPRLPQALATKNKRIALAPADFVKDVERLEASLEGLAVSSRSLHLIGRRHLRSNNSWMHNCERLVSGKERCTLLVHPKDADQLGLTHGGRARITTRVGSIEAPVEISDEIMQGVVSLPHGWGHDRTGTRQSVATQHAGVSLNDVTDERLFDALSGTTHFNGVDVAVQAITDSVEERGHASSKDLELSGRP
ncbi:MAG: molybdopterin-dependent oxidoreductase [Polyangiaceae bacterium]